MKPILYVTNVSENEISEDNEYVKKVREYAENENAKVIKLCVKIEEELSGLDDNDKKEMLEALEMDESGLDKVIKESYDLLGLMSFLTAGEPEVRAWTIKKEQKLQKQLVKYIQIYKGGLLEQKLFHMMI